MKNFSTYRDSRPVLAISEWKHKMNVFFRDSWSKKLLRLTVLVKICQLLMITTVFIVTANKAFSQTTLGGVNLGNLPKYLFVYTDARTDANWQGATKGFVGDVAIDGIQAAERTSGGVPYAGTIYTNAATLDAWADIVDQNDPAQVSPAQAFGVLNETTRITNLTADLENAFSQINALTATAGYTSIASTSLNGLNTQNSISETFVINVTSGFQVSSQINITGDAGDIFILRWDDSGTLSDGYQGQVKFQSGGAIIPLGGLKPTNFIHVAGEISSSGGGSNPAAPFPQGPRLNDGTGALITGAADFNGGGFFTGYWLTTGDPTNTDSGQPYGEQTSLSNGIFVGGWYSKNTKFSMTSGTSGVYVSPPCISGNAGTDGSTAICDNSIAVIDLFSLITGEQTGGVWTRTSGTGGSFNAALGTFTPALGATTSTFTYTLTGTAPCPDDASVATVNISPQTNAGTDGSTAICDNSIAVVDLFSLITGEQTGGVWTRTSGTGGSFNAALGTFTPALGATTSTFTYTLTGTAPCPDDASVATVNISPQTNAGTDGSTAICDNSIAVVDLFSLITGEQTGGVWTRTSGTGGTFNAALGTFTPAVGATTSTFTYTLTGTAPCPDDASVATVNISPQTNAGTDGSTAICDNSIAVIDLFSLITGEQTGGVWTRTTGTGGTFNAALGTFTPAVGATTSTFTYTLTGTAPCPDDASVATVNISPKPTVAIVPNSVKCSIDLTTYSLKFVATGGTVTASAGTLAADSVFNIPKASSVKLVITSEAGCKDSVTVTPPNCEIPCVKPTWSVIAPICSIDLLTYSVSFTITGKNGILKTNYGVLSGSNPYTITGIPNGASLKITDSLSAVCKYDTLVAGPNCNCTPKVPIIFTPSFTICIGDTFPTLKATVIGLATVEWFATNTDTTILATGLTYKPTGTVTGATTTFYARARSTDSECPLAISTERASVTINSQDCATEIDLVLDKSIDKKIHQEGDTVVYIIKVWNESQTLATGVEVADSLNAALTYVSSSADKGAYNPTTYLWTIGDIAAGDTVTLTIKAKIKVGVQGPWFNTAQICKANEKDVDSAPCNDIPEDDIDNECFTVPFKLCTGEKIEASVPSSYTNVQWFKQGVTTPIATGNTVLLSDVGTYTYTATGGNCPAGGCCPIIIEAGDNCCPTEVCIPFTVKKLKKTTL